MSSSRSSAVWNFFKKTNKDNVVCNLCGKNYKTCGNTSNLAAHLRNKHYHAFSKFKNTAGKSTLESEPSTKTRALDKQRGLSFRTSSPTPSTSTSLTSIAAHDRHEADIEIIENENIAGSSASILENCDVSIIRLNQKVLSQSQ